MKEKRVGIYSGTKHIIAQIGEFEVGQTFRTKDLTSIGYRKWIYHVVKDINCVMDTEEKDHLSHVFQKKYDPSEGIEKSIKAGIIPATMYYDCASCHHKLQCKMLRDRRNIIIEKGERVLKENRKAKAFANLTLSIFQYEKLLLSTANSGRKLKDLEALRTIKQGSDMFKP